MGTRDTISQVPTLKQAPLLLTNTDLPIENGYSLTKDGMYHIAASTTMPAVTGEMIDFWFGFVSSTETYKQWHPRDHVSSAWAGPHGDSTYIGGHHLVREFIGGKLMKLRISFKSPAKYFGPDWAARFADAGVATAVCARVALWAGFGTLGLPVGHVVHLVHREGEGVRMRSRFWLGDVPGVVVPFVRRLLVGEGVARGLQEHAGQEMAILAGFLPELYRKEMRRKGERQGAV